MKTVETIPKLYSKEIILDTADNSILIINGTSITAETGSFSELNISGSIMTSTVSGSTALFTVISGSTVTGSKALFTVLTGSAILISGDITTSGGNIVIGQSGKGIDFSATANSTGVMTSELLNDYEEGTWTPAISGSTTGGVFTYNTGSGAGFYSKIGNLVYVNGFIDVSAVSTPPTGNLRITGLPYTSTNFRSSGINFIDLRGTTAETILSGAQGNLSDATIAIWKASSAAIALTSADLSPSNGIDIFWQFTGFYRA